MLSFMATLHTLQHTRTEGPARIAEISRVHGHDLHVVPLFDGAEVPSVLPAGDGLLVLGGPMGVGDLHDPQWPFLSAEVDLLRSVLGDGRPVLGVCLGAQLMAHALGARVYPLTVGEPPVRHREVGWGSVSFLRNAQGAAAILAGLHDSEVVVHWHGDTFDLPIGAERLASTLSCPNQMFRFGDRAFGVQFHVELTPSDLLDWVESDAEFVRAALGPSGSKRIIEETAVYAECCQRAGDRLIENLLDAMFDQRALTG
jgi:GMP synthase-like glutamine amidotransferase